MGKPFGEDEKIPTLLGQIGVVQGQEAADIGQAVLLGRHGGPIDQGEHLPGDVPGRAITLTRLPGLDEPGVFGETACVQEKRDPVAVAHLPHLAQVLQRDRLTAAGVVGDRDHHERYVVRAYLGDGGLEAANVHVALEGIIGRVVMSLFGHEVPCLGALVLDIGPGGVEMGVIGHHVPGGNRGGEEDPLGRPALMGGDDVFQPGDGLHRVPEPIKGAASRIGLVTAHHSRPLGRGHGSRPRVGQQVDHYLVGVEAEQVVARSL